jgi:hypothetical protein
MLARAIESWHMERNYYRYGKSSSTCEFDGSYNNPAGSGGGDNYDDMYAMPGRGLHSFPFPLNLSLLCPFPLNLS